MTFDSIPESHTYKYSTFQAQNPGRFLSCMRKEMALLTFSLPAGIIVRGYEDRVVILCLFSNFFFFISVRAAPYFSHLELQRWRPRLCETRERFSVVEIPKHKCRFVWFNAKQSHWLAKKYRVTFSANQNTNPKSIHVRLLRAFHALGSVFATLDNTIIIFLSPLPPPPPKKIYITIVFSFSWDLESSQEKLKTMVMQNCGGGGGGGGTKR